MSCLLPGTLAAKRTYHGKRGRHAFLKLGGIALGIFGSRCGPGRTSNPLLEWTLACSLCIGQIGTAQAVQGPGSGLAIPARLAGEIQSHPQTISRARPETVLTMTATGYCSCSICCGRSADGITATGMKAQPGVAAVDPGVIPLGSRLFIEGYGPAIAGDTGSAIRGLRIDLFFDSHREALNFGKKRLKVHVLSRAP